VLFLIYKLVVVQVAICCSQEQIHNFEFVRERSSEPHTVVDSDDDDTSELRLPNIGKWPAFQIQFCRIAFLLMSIW
jgi:hypothetical protein